jgi:hypothetical protein
VAIFVTQAQLHELGHIIEKEGDIKDAFNKLVTDKNIKPISVYAASDGEKEFFSESFNLY